jgi:hypothetical protein
MVRSIALFIVSVAHAPAVVAADAATPPRPMAPAEPPAYVSALADYKPWRDTAPAPWKRVNDDVGRLGGHMGHLRGDAAPPKGDKPAPPAEAKR